MRITKPGLFLKKLREEEDLSQRDFSERSGLSFRHLQRIEAGSADITSQKLDEVLQHFGFELKYSRRAPNWEFLSAAGLPLVESHSHRFPYKISQAQIIRETTAALSSSKNSLPNLDGRLFDSLKSFVLTLQTHYPSLFSKIARREDTSWLQLKKIEGRHIKLRNISLQLLSTALKNGGH